ncbi:MAG: TonB-dependent receptor [Paludibacter sp.]|nr:TonB-dependent receptor [Paludibacter sp.]
MKNKNAVNQKEVCRHRMLLLKMFCMLILISTAPLAFAQSVTIKGNVKDSQGSPLPGVAVKVQGTSQGTLTDVDGNYSISVPSSKSMLIFSFIGMETEKITVGTQKAISLTMKDSSIALNEVVSIGYARVKKSDVTGALTQVTAKTLEERPVQNAISAMQGKAAGVDVQSNNRPGEISNVVIRGTRSINGSNSPLYVVDGVILMGDMNDINPNDIASMEILKDASSTAIYGSRGANGVVLITTKNGKKGKINIDYTGTVTFDVINSVTDWASAGEMLDRYRLANINGGTYKSGSTNYMYPDPAVDLAIFGHSDAATMAAIRSAYDWNSDGTVKTRATTSEEQAAGWPAQVPVYNSGNVPTTDWTKYLTRTGVTQNHQVALSSGNDVSKLYMSLGYYNNKGTQENQGYKRYSVRMNGETSPLKWLTVGVNLNTSLSEQKYGTSYRTGSSTGPNDAYGLALSQYVMAKPYDDNGNLILYPGNNQSLPTWNPLINLSTTDDLTRKLTIQANTFADIKFTPWLKYHMNFGAGYRTSNSGSWQGSGSTTRLKSGLPTTAVASYSTSEVYQYLIENLLYANKTFGKHDLGLTLMQSGQYARNVGSNMSASSIFYDACKWYNLAANSNGKPDSYGTSFSETSMISYMARFNYSFMSRYLLNASLRSDGASQLADGHKWDLFPSASVAWKLHEESFMKSFKWVDELKLRFGMGTSGNSAVGAYSSAGPLAQYAYTWGTTAAYGMIPYNMPNPSLGWEHTSQYNLGLDFAFLNQRLTGTLEFYLSNTRDILMYRSIVPITGYAQIMDNIGKMRNKGVEFTISSKNIVKKDFSWSTDLSVSSNKNQIVELVNGKQDMAGNNWYIGQPLNVFRTYHIAGIWQNTTEDLAEIAKWKANGYTFAVGQYKPQELGTPDYKLTDADKSIVGSTDPKVVLGLTNTFTYKNWEFSFFLYSRLGQKYFSSLLPAGINGTNYVGYGRHVKASDFWSPSNPSGKYPQPSTASAATVNASLTQASYVNDGSYVIVRNISLGYKLPAKFANKLNMKSMQIFGQVMNPFIFGGEVVKAGLNPDDTNGWTSTNSVGESTGGTNNNTIINTSFVAGVRVSF